MPFLDELHVTVRGRDYIVTRPFRYAGEYMGVYYQVTVPVGFRTDFASVPRIFRGIFTGHDRTRKAAVIHDYMYRTHRHGRVVADHLFKQAMKESGVPFWKRTLMFAGVRIGGWTHW